jgi:SHS2 domain-containing protein
MRYEVLEHTADVMVKTHGRTIEECFVNAAYALYDQMVDTSAVEPNVEEEVKVCGHDLESLLYNFLSEFLYLTDAKRLVFGDFKVEIDGMALRCIARGERINRARHELRHEVKAITYHMLKVDINEPSVTVIFDI